MKPVTEWLIKLHARSQFPKQVTICLWYCVLVVFTLWVSTPARSQSFEDIAKGPSYEFEQCANDCQLEADKELLNCDGYRKPEDGAGLPDCRQKLHERYQICLKECPPNRNAQQ